MTSKPLGIRARLLGARTSREGEGVTTLELFFDLVFVFAFHQVGALVSHDEDPLAGLGKALIVLALVWWSWTSYSWLGNQARADSGAVRLGLIVAAVLVFVVALAIPEAFHDLPGGLDGPLVFVVAYLLVRLVHGLVYLLAAGDDRELRGQVLVTLSTGYLLSAALLVAGAVADAEVRWIWWLAAVVADYGLVFLFSRGGGRWRLKSAAHFGERYGLIVILALGESIIAVGADAAREPIGVPVLLGAVLAIVLALGVWWSYFAGTSARLEEQLARREGPARASLAVGVYTYLHLLLVAGIVVVAVGIEFAMAGVVEGEPVGAFTAWMLCGGLACYLLGTVLALARAGSGGALPRTITVLLLLALAPVVALVPALPALVIVAGLLWLVLAVERRLAGLSQPRPLG